MLFVSSRLYIRDNTREEAKTALVWKHYMCIMQMAGHSAQPALWIHMEAAFFITLQPPTPCSPVERECLPSHHVIVSCSPVSQLPYLLFLLFFSPFRLPPLILIYTSVLYRLKHFIPLGANPVRHKNVHPGGLVITVIKVSWERSIKELKGAQEDITRKVMSV